MGAYRCNRTFAKLNLFLLTLVSSACLGNGCSLDPSVVEGPRNASILQGWNHTFWCKGIGSYIEWEINGIPVYKLGNDSKLKLVNTTDTLASGSCTQESAITVHAEYIASKNITLSSFTIQCVSKKNFNVAVVSEAWLKVHVVGEVGALELISPTSHTSLALIQWKAPDVFFESSSPLYYNITVRNSFGEVIAQTTTTDTFFPIDNDLLVSCDLYQLTMLPFQKISSKTELGIVTQEIIFPPPLPPTNVNLSVSVQTISAKATIYFQVQPTNCSFQWPEKFTVTVKQQGTITNESLQSAEQTVVGTMNNYTLEELKLRKKYQVSIKLERTWSSSAPELTNFSTFNLQNLVLAIKRDRQELNIHCDMAKGAEDKNCTIEMRNETRVLQQNCFQTSGSGRDATCELGELTLGKYWIQAYDQELKETPAVERVFHFTKELYEDLTSTAPSTRINDATTNLASSPSRVDEETEQNYLIVGTVTPIAVVITAAALVISFAIVIIKFHRKKQGTKNHLRDAEAAAQTAEKIEYEKHKTPMQQDSLTESTAHADAQTAVMENVFSWEHCAVAESTVGQQSTYADSHTMINTTATSNKSSNQYQKQRKELVHSCLENMTVPHSPNHVQTPACTSL